MKLFRICYYTILTGFFFAGIITGRREIFLLFFIMFFLLFASLMLVLWTALSFSFVQELSEKTAVKGGTVNLKINIYNDKPFPFTLMKIYVQTVKYNSDTVLSFNLSPKSRISFDVPVYAAYRGVYDIGMAKLEINDIFGLMQIKFDMRKLSYYRMRTLTVYPKLVELPFLPARLSDAKLAGGAAMRVSEEGEAFSALRDYRHGDTAKRIHWKASAGKRELLVKNYDTPAENGVMIAVDLQANEEEGENLLIWADIACECAAMIAKYSTWAGYNVLLIDSAPASRAVEAGSRQDFAVIYDRLAVMPFGKGADFAGKIKAEFEKRQSIEAVYIVSSRHEGICAAVNEMLHKGCRVKCLMPNAGRDAVQAAMSAMPGASCTAVEFGSDIASWV